MKKLVVVFTFILSLSSWSFAAALAQSHALRLSKADMTNSTVMVQPSTNGSNYSDLLGYFTKGQVPTGGDLQGLWSGRAYLKAAPNQPFGMVLAAEYVTQTVGENNGPAFPPPTQETTLNINLLNYNGANEAPDRFDNLSSGNKADIEQYLQSDEFKKLTSTVVDDSLTVIADAQNLKSMVRKYGDYFIVEAVVIRDVSTLKAGDIYTMAYFFKKVHN